MLAHEPISARSSDLDLIRGSPYRPAASEMAAIQGLTEDCARSLSQVAQKTSCKTSGNHRRASSILKVLHKQAGHTTVLTNVAKSRKVSCKIGAMVWTPPTSYGDLLTVK